MVQILSLKFDYIHISILEVTLDLNGLPVVLKSSDYIIEVYLNSKIMVLKVENKR